MSNLKAKLKKQGGFTLVEMLIVVAIIAILIAIAIPMVNAALERAREATDSANERAAIGLAYVELMTDSTTILTVPSGDDPNKAVYVIKDNKGSLETKWPDTGTDIPKAYGKGTEAGDVKVSHAGQVIWVFVDKNGDVTADWKSTSGT